MGKHNGKARKPSGSMGSVGATLVNKARRQGKTNPATAHLHTTEVAQSNNMQSVLETNDLDELMNMVRAVFVVTRVLRVADGCIEVATTLALGTWLARESCCQD